GKPPGVRRTHPRFRCARAPRTERTAMSLAVPGVRVGHWQDERALTGCTVILPPAGTTGSAVVPGGAPATHEIDAIAPGRRVDEIHAVLLTGGSAFGLGAA